MAHSKSHVVASRVARVSLGLNLLLCASKLSVGWIGGSFALLADGFNSLADVGISLAIIAGMYVAQRPADSEHAYGHGKLEQEISRFVSIIVLATSGGIIMAAVSRLSDVHESPSSTVLVVATGSIFVKWFLYRYQNRAAQQTGSDLLAADAMNHLMDVAATGCVVIGTLAIWVGGPTWAPVDNVAAIAIGALMAIAAGHLIYQSSSELLDRMPPQAVVDRIRAIAVECRGITGVERLVGRKTGMDYLIDVHLEVPENMSVAEAHELGHEAKNLIMHRMPFIKDMVVHLEPGRRDD